MQIPKEGQTGKPSPEPLRRGNDSVLGGEHARKKEVRGSNSDYSAMQETQVKSLGQEDCPGEKNGYPLQYSCLENSMDRGAWQTAVHSVAKSVYCVEQRL